MEREKLDELTIVIATLPRGYMYEWIEQIKGYIDFGYRVTIVIPPGFSKLPLKQLLPHSPHLKFLTSDRLGQVAQRTYGLSRVNTEFVMQMDDDIILDKRDVLKLVLQLKRLGDACCIAPRLAQFPSGKELQSHPDLKSSRGFIRYLLAILVYGARQLKVFELYGKTTRSGHGYGVPCRLELTSPLEVEWLPGGCILYRMKDAIVDNFYPFSGKAYAEDLIFSHLLKKQGTKLFYSNDVIAMTPPAVESNDPRIIFSFAKEHRARLAYVRMSRGNAYHLYLSYAWITINKAFAFITNRLFGNRNGSV